MTKADWTEFTKRETVREELQGKDLTEIVFVLDESGSMSGLESDTIGGYNGFLDKQKELKTRACISTVTFNNYPQVVHDRVNIEDVEHITNKEYEPGGGTALMDAVGGAVTHIAKLHRKLGENRPGKTIVVIITDGYENASRHYRKTDIKKLITTLQKDEGWEFIFLGANIDAADEAESYGISRDRAVKYCSDERGTADNFEAMSECMYSICDDALSLQERSDRVELALNKLRKKNKDRV